MFIGDKDLSRARGSKAQKRIQNQTFQQQENTIDFQQAVNKFKPRPIELRPKTQAQENLVMHLCLPAVLAAAGPP